MSNASTANVIRIDTSAQYTGIYRICGIKYIGNTSGTASIKADSSSGQTVWEESGSANVWNAELELELRNGMYITVTNSAVVYLYLE